jgi:hypothetical protein
MSLKESNLLTVTYTPTNFANILNVSLLVGDSVIVTQRRSGELEVHDATTFQVVRVHITDTSMGEWLLQASTPGTFDIQVAVYGDTGFFSYIDGQCTWGTTHKTAYSAPQVVTVSP